MRKVAKKSPLKKRSEKIEQGVHLEKLTASQRRLLEILITGTDTDEPSLLAGRP